MAENKARLTTKHMAELLNRMRLHAEVSDDGSINLYAEVTAMNTKYRSARFVLRSSDLGEDDREKLATLGVLVGADVMASMMMALRVNAGEDALDLLIKRATGLKSEALGGSEI